MPVSFQLGADPSGALAAYEKVIQKQDQLIQKLRLTKAESQGATSEHVSGMNQAGAAVAGFAAKIATMAVSVMSVREVFSLWKTDMQDVAKGISEVASRLKDLEFSEGNWKRGVWPRREAYEQAAKWAVPGGAGEVGEARAAMMDLAGGVSAGYREKLFTEMLQHRMITAAPMPSLVPLYGKPAEAAERQGMSPNELQNLIRTLQDKAAVTGEGLTAIWPKALASFDVGKLNLIQGGALLTRITEVTGTAKEANSALGAITDALMKEPTKETKPIFGRAGIVSGMNVTDRLRQLSVSYAAGQLPEGDLQKIAGTAGPRVLGPLLREWQRIPEMTKAFEAEVGGGRDLIGEAIAMKMKSDPVFAAGTETARLKNRQDLQKELDAARALRFTEAAQFIQTRGQEQGAGPVRRFISDTAFWLRGWMGGDPDELAAEFAAATVPLPGPFDRPDRPSDYRRRYRAELGNFRSVIRPDMPMLSDTQGPRDDAGIWTAEERENQARRIKDGYEPPPKPPPIEVLIVGGESKVHMITDKKYEEPRDEASE